jgi:hypothetical protein
MANVEYKELINRDLPPRDRGCTSKVTYVSPARAPEPGTPRTAGSRRIVSVSVPVLRTLAPRPSAPAGDDVDPGQPANPSRGARTSRAVGHPAIPGESPKRPRDDIVKTS